MATLHPHFKNNKNKLTVQLGQRELTNSRRGGVLALIENFNLSNVQIAKRLHCHEKTVRNIKKRAQNAEKENIDVYETEAVKDSNET